MKSKPDSAGENSFSLGWRQPGLIASSGRAFWVAAEHNTSRVADPIFVDD